MVYVYVFLHSLDVLHRYIYLFIIYSLDLTSLSSVREDLRLTVLFYFGLFYSPSDQWQLLYRIGKWKKCTYVYGWIPSGDMSFALSYRMDLYYYRFVSVFVSLLFCYYTFQTSRRKSSKKNRVVDDTVFFLRTGDSE